MTGKYTAPRDVRLNFGCVLWITFTGGIGSIVIGVSSLPSMLAWVQIVLGIDLLAITVGIWYAKEWARWAAGILTAINALASLAKVVFGIAVKGEALALLGLIGVAWWGLLTWCAFHPATRKSFADAREMIARSREPIRGR